MNSALFHSAAIPPGSSGTQLDVTREQAGWNTINFAVRGLAAGQVWKGNTGGEEAALVLLGGRVVADFGRGPRPLGERENVFAGFPHALYLPHHTDFEVIAVTDCEIADCRAVSSSNLEPRVITPDDVVSVTRGGGNATRQIVDLIRPEFPAEKLMICEVYTPGGNWSSYPPHKHDVHNPPVEVDLDETYYFRLDAPDGYAFERLYDPRRQRDETLVVRDGDLVVVRDGYHTVVTAHGYNCYYLNVLVGSARSMAASDDPRYAYLRSNWPQADPRVPMVHDTRGELHARKASHSGAQREG
ncbi:MAG: 5-deoxy-glucuronate isomerase [Candidatus Acidiferrales bacterium]